MSHRIAHLPLGSSRSRRGLAAALLAVAALLWLGTTTALPAGPSFSSSGTLPGLGSGRIWKVAFSPNNPNLAAAGTDNGVYISQDGGQTWSQSGLKGSRVWVVGFDLRAPYTLFAGLQGQGIRASADSGGSWSDVSSGLVNRNVRAMAFSLGGIAAGTDEGVALSSDGKSWKDGGLETYGVSALAVVANSPAPVFVAGVDRGDVSKGFLFRDDGPNGQWTALTSGLPGTAVVSSISSGPLSQTVSQHPLLVTTSKGTLRSGDGGNTWSASAGVPDGLFLTTSAYSPLDPNLVYAGADAGGSSGGGLLRSTDGGTTFSIADAGLPSPQAQQPATKEVESLAVAATTPPSVLAALDIYNGPAQIYRMADTSAPAPPQLVVEPGGSLPPLHFTPPAANATTAPSASATPTPHSNAFVGFVTAAFHFPTPLIFEVLFVAAVAFLWVRWRRHYYVEGPP